MKKNLFQKLVIHILFQGDLVKQMKDSNVNKDDAEFKQAINELKIRKKKLEDQVERKISVYK